MGNTFERSLGAASKHFQNSPKVPTAVHRLRLLCHVVLDVPALLVLVLLRIIVLVPVYGRRQLGRREPLGQLREREWHEHQAAHNEVGRVRVHALSPCHQPLNWRSLQLKDAPTASSAPPFRQSQKQLRPKTVPHKRSVWISCRIRCDPQLPRVVDAPL